MTDDTVPFAPDELDELLSAELDNELEAAARDFGLPLAQVTARMRATPGVDARRRALLAARDLLAAPPEFEELLDARLRAKAVRAVEGDAAAHASARRLRQRHVLQAVGGIAAAALLVVAVAAGLRHTDNPSASKATSAAPVAGGSTEQASSPAARAFVAEKLGAFANEQELGLAAVRLVSPVAADAAGQSDTTHQSTKAVVGASTTAPPRLNSGAQPDSVSSTAGKTAPVYAGAFSYDNARAAAGMCTAPKNASVTGQLVLRAAAVLSGKAVVVLVFADNDQHTVLIEDPNCVLQSKQTMG